MRTVQKNLVIEGNRLIKVIDDDADDLVIPEGVEIICEDAARENSSLTVVLPESLRRIEGDAFTNMVLLRKPVHIPAGVEDIAFDAFGDAPATFFTVDERNPRYYAVDGVLYDRKARLPDLYDMDRRAIPLAEQSDLSQIDDWDIVSFGRYPQTAEGNDMTPVDWLVLSAYNDHVLLISRFALDCVPFESDCWKKSGLRSWLNGEFFDTAFNPEEQAMIEPAEPEGDYLDGLAGERVYALNNKEAEHLFKDERNMIVNYAYGTFDYEDAKERQCVATPYAVARGVDVYAETKSRPGKACTDWWLRTYAPRHGGSTFLVDCDGDFSLVSPWIGHVAARPVIRVNLKAK